MPELPEVEVLVRSLRPLLLRRVITGVQVFRERVLRPCSTRQLKRKLLHARFTGLERRGKYLLFHLQDMAKKQPFKLVGHLGMTGRMYLTPEKQELPKHAAVVLNLGNQKFVFEDTRYFGRLTLDTRAVEVLGPEPLDKDFHPQYLFRVLRRSSQAIKVKLLDQSIVAGIGNIYASEALFRAGISPRTAARRLKLAQMDQLVSAIREVLSEAIDFGSTVPLSFAGKGQSGLFYFGKDNASPGYYEERLRVYDRAKQPCPRCGAIIKRLVQAGRSTFYCAACQKIEKSTRGEFRFDATVSAQ